MEVITQLYEGIRSIIPMAIAAILSIIIIWLVKLALEKRYASAPDKRFRMHLVVLLLSFAGIIIIIIVSPLSDGQQGQLLSLIGILLSAAIALSSTTFLGNIMAGMMLRIIRSFRPGDFVLIGEHFGRVSERGLFHIEIQTEDRDLMTLPNLYLITNPVKVIRSSGTIVATEISLGYDISHGKIEKLLIQAAIDTGLEEPFVHIIKLGDFSVTYRISGLLSEVKQIITVRSKLKEKVLDRLHEGNVEIVSPTFMNTRAIPADKRFVPKEYRFDAPEKEKKAAGAVEIMVFDKAEEAESLEKLRERLQQTNEEIDRLKMQLKQTDSQIESMRLEEKQKPLESYRERLSEYIKGREARKNDS